MDLFDDDRVDHVDVVAVEDSAEPGGVEGADEVFLVEGGVVPPGQLLCSQPWLLDGEDCQHGQVVGRGVGDGGGSDAAAAKGVDVIQGAASLADGA